MIKKILPTMIGAALVGSMTAAAADVSVSGHLDYAIVNFDDNTSTGPGSDDTNLRCTTCSVGFSGSEDLGNGLKAIFKIDFQFDGVNRNSSGSITDRDQWVGLGGGFGKIRIGTISTPYKSTGAMIDPLYRTALQGRAYHLQSDFHNGAGEELLALPGTGGGRADNTFRYDSPDFNGFKAAAHYTLDSDETDGEDDNPYGIGGTYSNGGILAFANWQTNDGSATTPNGDINGWKVGGKFSMNAFAVMGQYEDIEADFGASEEATNWHIAGTYTMGNNLVYAAYGNYTEEAGGVEFEDTDTWTIALMHSLSKRTKAYAGYNNQDDSNAVGGTQVDEDTFALGIKHKF
jgi:predicted porin